MRAWWEETEWSHYMAICSTMLMSTLSQLSIMTFYWSTKSKVLYVISLYLMSFCFWRGIEKRKRR